MTPKVTLEGKGSEMTTNFDVVEWFAEKAGKTSYKIEIDDLKTQIEEIKLEALHNANKAFYVAGLMRRIKEKEAEIERVYREAQDRYDDCAT